MSMFDNTIFEASNKYNSGAFAHHVGGDKFCVTCLQCCAVIAEVMDRPTLMSAIKRTSGRGGVLCQECREVTCDSCGLTFQGERLRLVYITNSLPILKNGNPTKNDKGELVYYDVAHKLCQLCDMQFSSTG